MIARKTPALTFKVGHADWIESWQQTTTPARWMEHSVVWYSHQVTAALGAEKLESYARATGYGNADFSGDDALERPWMKDPPTNVAGGSAIWSTSYSASRSRYSTGCHLNEASPSSLTWPTPGKG